MYKYIYIYIYGSEGFALTGCVVPGCVEDGAWMLWGNYSVVIAVDVADAVLTRPFFGHSVFSAQYSIQRAQYSRLSAQYAVLSTAH